MLDFSFAEIALIVVVAVIFIGPEELPVVIRTIAKAMRGVKSLMREMKQLAEEISRESGFDDLTKDVTLIKGDDGKMYESYPNPVNPNLMQAKDPLPDNRPPAPEEPK